LDSNLHNVVWLIYTKYHKFFIKFHVALVIHACEKNINLFTFIWNLIWVNTKSCRTFFFVSYFIIFIDKVLCFIKTLVLILFFYPLVSFPGSLSIFHHKSSFLFLFYFFKKRKLSLKEKNKKQVRGKDLCGSWIRTSERERLAFQCVAHLEILHVTTFSMFFLKFNLSQFSVFIFQLFIMSPTH